MNNMVDQYMVSMMDISRNISFDSNALLTYATINGLHFPDLTISEISDTGGGSRTSSFIYEGTGMCEPMMESYLSAGGIGGHDETTLINHTNMLQSDPSTAANLKIEKRDSMSQKRRSRKSQFDASLDATLSLDKIEPVHEFDDQNESDDAWLYKIPKTEYKNDQATDNIFSWVHKEFKTNDVKASKHLLLCKLDDMSNARAIRSVSCHSFAHRQRSDNTKRSLTEQEVNSESVKNGRLSSPLRTINSLFNGNEPMHSVSPTNLSTFRPNIVITSANENHTVSTKIQPRDTSKEYEPLDYIDLEDLRQAEREGPLFKRFGGSNASLASNNTITNATRANRSDTKPPVAPKSTIIRNGVKTNNLHSSTIQTNTKINGQDAVRPIQSKSSVTTARATILPSNSANKVRTRPVTIRPFQPYRSLQTSYNNTEPKIQVASSSVQRPVKKLTNVLSSTATKKELSSNENGLLNDVRNKPLTGPIRSQVEPQQRTVLPHSSTYSSGERTPSSSSSVNIRTHRQTIIPRSSSSTISQGRKSGMPPSGTQLKSSTTTLTRPSSSKINPSTQSLNSKMTNRTVRGQEYVVRPQLSAWNEGCY